jgi:hypothetical protein
VRKAQDDEARLVRRAVASHAGIVTIPPAWWLAAAVLGTLAVVDLLASITARIGARRPLGEILQAESA